MVLYVLEHFSIYLTVLTLDALPSTPNLHVNCGDNMHNTLKLLKGF